MVKVIGGKVGRGRGVDEGGGGSEGVMGASKSLQSEARCPFFSTKSF